MKLKNKVNTLIQTILFVLFAVCFLSSIASFIIIKHNSFFVRQLDYEGFNNFQTYFSFPLKAFWLSTILFGILMAYKKYQQTNEHFELTSNNIQFINYFKHMNMYATFMLEYFIYFRDNIADTNIENNNNFGINIEPDKTIIDTKLTKGFFTNLYQYWFNRKSKTLGIIKDDVHKNMVDLSEYIVKHKSEILDSNDHFFKLDKKLKNIYTPKLDLKLYDNEVKENNFRLKIIIALIKKSLDFSGQKIENIDNLYKDFCKEKP